MKTVFVVVLLAMGIADCFGRNHEDFKPNQSQGGTFGGRRQPNPLQGYKGGRNRRELSDDEPLPETLPIAEHEHYYHQEQNARHKRQVFGNVEKSSAGGTLVTAGGKGNLFNENGHRVDGTAQVSRNFNPGGPMQYGGGVQYQGPKAGGSVDVNTARHMGTGVSATGNVNLFESRNHNTRLDGNANYQQHFGPRTRPEFGGGLKFTHRF